MSKIEVDAIDKQSGSTLTLGGSGTAVTLACGATQTGFGRSGSVNWDTTAKTVTFTGVSGNGYFVNTTGGVVTANLPASPSAGDIMAVVDYAGTSDTNNITIGRNGSNINGAASDQIISNENSGATFVYVDGTQGWKFTETSNISDIELQPTFICASVSGSGNTLVTAPDCANAKVATFTGPGTFSVNSVANCGANNVVSYIVVGGGGSGGMTAAGGGGAGGFREGKSPVTPYTSSPLIAPTGLTVTATAFPITIGGGGAGTTTNPSPGNPGNPSTFSSITSTGGGSGGGGTGPGSGTAAGSGGSGGGAQGGTSPANPTGGAGNTPPVSPSQGFPGGPAPSPSGSPAFAGGGGGGATTVGENGHNAPPYGDGGAGATTSISSTGSTIYAGGGGGSSDLNSPGDALAGPGGGGVGGIAGIRCAGAGTVNTGGGSGALAYNNSTAAAGGSGIVIIRYKFQ
jgi:hypothetical protein